MADPSTNVILIVDDVPANLDVISEALSDAGYEVAIATSGERALKRVQNHPPDLILLDVMMPGVDGFEVCRRLKADAQTQTIPVIFMTALSDSDSKLRAFELGAVDYVTKPFQETEVLARIKTHLQLRHLNQCLEQQVSQRTAQLAQALHDLQASQVQLVQSEKMSALGNLVAGVAHEINNPINFIVGNMSHADEYIRSLLAVFQLYQSEYPHPTTTFQNELDRLDFQFISKDLLKVLASMKVGSERIQEIVRSLRIFSRLDEAEVKAVDIHEGIKSTLLILQHRLKASVKSSAIAVVQDFDKLPLIECYPGQLNQVFMNILVNAIDAIEEARIEYLDQELHNPPGCITIRTAAIDSQWIEIAIADNGAGMTEVAQQNVFNSFFTTKPVGKGIGLGMSISYQIITEKHGGKLNCFSTIGRGSEFIVQIPIKQLKAK